MELKKLKVNDIATLRILSSIQDKIDYIYYYLGELDRELRVYLSETKLSLNSVKERTKKTKSK